MDISLSTMPTGETWEEEDGSQEMEKPQDLASCWGVISRQSAQIESQQATLARMSTQMASIQLQLTRLLEQQPTGPSDPPGSAPVTVEQMAQMWNQKGAPPPEPFSLMSGRSFEKFIKQFEAHCKGKYSMESYEEWTADLGPYLKDEVHDMYIQCGGGEVNMTDMKTKLSQYCKGEESKRVARNLERFTAAQPGPDESIYMYATRLERLYLASHPGVDPEDNLDLSVKYMASINITDHNEIQRELDTIATVTQTEDGYRSWKVILDIVKRINNRINKRSYPVKREPMEPQNAIWYTSTNVLDQNLDMDYQDERRSRSQYRSYRGYGPRSYSRDYWRTPRINNISQHRSRSLSQRRNSTQNRQNNYNNNNGNYNPHYGGNPNNYNNDDNSVIYCDWCGNPGHIQRNCWRKLGYCLRCGSNQHMLRDCPKPPRNQRTPRQPRQPGYPPASASGANYSQRQPQQQQSPPLQQPQRPNDRRNAAEGTDPLNPHASA